MSQRVEDLGRLRKNELVGILGHYGEDGSSMNKREVISRITLLREERPEVEGDNLGEEASQDQTPSQPTSATRSPQSVSDGGSLDISLESQRAAAYASQMAGPFACLGGRLEDKTIVFDVQGPAGDKQQVRFNEVWPPTCTCADSESWAHKQRCKHACYILVKCGSPYAAVSDGSWEPDARYAKSIYDSMLGPWTAIPLTKS